jgi:hypothetical protein
VKDENEALVTGEEIIKQFGKIFEEFLNPQTHQTKTILKLSTIQQNLKT